MDGPVDDDTAGRLREAEQNYHDDEQRVRAGDVGTDAFQRAVRDLRDSRDALDDAQQVEEREGRRR